MHSFLKAVGFSNVKTRKDVEHLTQFAKEAATERYVSQVDPRTARAELYYDCGNNVGVALRGEYDENGNFHTEYYFPYIRGTKITSRENVFISRRVDTDAYTGMCEDYRIGVSLIFYLQNLTEFISRGYPENNADCPVILSALASEGKILLPTMSMVNAPVDAAVDPSGRMQLMEAARKGDKEAMETLTIDDIDLYARINKRLKSEDIFSIVETSFVPYGSESDNYTILGIIDEVTDFENKVTGEKLVLLEINCNNIQFPVCINRNDLIGEPKKGRRFRGNIWMQGMVEFH